MYELPPILTGSEQEQLRSLRDYLVRLCRSLERGENAPTAGAAGSAGTSALAPGSGGARSRAESDSLRSLIVKTADRVERQVELLSRSLHEDYLARSDFGDYQEQIDTLIRATARQIVESYDFTARLSAADERLGELAGALTRLRGEIRRGLIQDPETGELCFASPRSCASPARR